MKITARLLCLCLFHTWVFAGKGEPEVKDESPLPEGAAVSFALPEHAIIGERLVGTYIIQNTGAAAFSVSRESDMEVMIEARDEKGNRQTDVGFQVHAHTGPEPAPVRIEPGGRFEIPCRSDQFPAIVSPGRYTVTAWYCNARSAEKPAPEAVATTLIDFQRPTPQFAAARVHSLCAAKPTDAEAWQVNWDLEHLWDPAYLPALLHEVQAGNVRACYGLGGILSKEASVALLGLASSKNPRISAICIGQLADRLPCLAGVAAPRALWSSNRSQSAALANGYWPAKLDRPLLGLAEKRLTLPLKKAKPGRKTDVAMEDGLPGSRHSFLAAAVIIAKRGGPAQADTLLAALQRDLDLFLEPRNDPSGLYNEDPPSLHSLFETLDALRARGWIIKAPKAFAATPSFHGKAGALALFRQFADPKIPKPAGDSWEHLIRAHFHSPSPWVRESALRALPMPLTDGWEPLLLQALSDPDRGVVLAACAAAAKSGRKSFLPPLAQLLQKIPDHFPGESLKAITTALQQLGGSSEAWDALSNRLTDDEIGDEVMRQLCVGTIELQVDSSGTSGANPTPEQRAETQLAWKTFLWKNHESLANGKRVPKDDPSITPAMVGLNFNESPVVSMTLQDGTTWPHFPGSIRRGTLSRGNPLRRCCPLQQPD